jgi:hypothetical protein
VWARRRVAVGTAAAPAHPELTLGVPHRYLLFPDEGHELLHRSSRARFLHETVDRLISRQRPSR